MSEAVFVEAPARLHFGVLDLRGDLGRRFGGIGAAVPAPSLLLEARRAASPPADSRDTTGWTCACTSACIGPFLRTRGSARVRSSRSPWRARAPSCAVCRPT